MSRQESAEVGGRGGEEGEGGPGIAYMPFVVIYSNPDKFDNLFCNLCKS